MLGLVSSCMGDRLRIPEATVVDINYGHILELARWNTVATALGL